jgi:antitoxin (DNA-binding transcriptional repressor) of toxin-antitoxin stability system
MDEVAASGEPVIVTKHGKPVARLVPADAKQPKSIFGALKGQVTIKGDIIAPLDVEWDALKE